MAESRQVVYLHVDPKIQQTEIHFPLQVCLDHGLYPEPSKCIIYSFGVNDEWSFEDVMGVYGCQIFAFDPAGEVADHDRSDNIHFYNMGIASQNIDRGFNGRNLRTLSAVYEMLKSRHGEVNIDYLKMDIEFGEWDVLPQILQSGMMDKVVQLAVEIHFKPDGNINWHRRFVQIIKSIEDYGMVRFSSTVNVLAQKVVNDVGVEFHSAYELAWYNNRYLK